MRQSFSSFGYGGVLKLPILIARGRHTPRRNSTQLTGRIARGRHTPGRYSTQLTGRTDNGLRLCGDYSTINAIWSPYARMIELLHRLGSYTIH